MLAQQGRTAMDRQEIVGPRLERVRDMAVLSYVWDAAVGANQIRWRATDVYRQQPDGAWKIVHAHWSVIQPAAPA